MYLNIALTAREERELKKIRKEAEKIDRNFWIRVMHRAGYTNVAIAKEVGLTESTVRATLKQ